MYTCDVVTSARTHTQFTCHRTTPIKVKCPEIQYYFKSKFSALFQIPPTVYLNGRRSAICTERPVSLHYSSKHRHDDNNSINGGMWSKTCGTEAEDEVQTGGFPWHFQWRWVSNTCLYPWMGFKLNEFTKSDTLRLAACKELKVRTVHRGVQTAPSCERVRSVGWLTHV
jgi:hypothetical protein